MRTEAILSALESGQQIEEVALDNLTIDEHSNVIQILNTAKSLKNFKIEHSLLSEHFLKNLGIAIGKHTALTEVAIKECTFSVEDFSVFSESVKHNKSIKKFELFLAVIDDKEIADLLQGFVDGPQFCDLTLDTCPRIGMHTIGLIQKWVEADNHTKYVSIKNCNIEDNIHLLRNTCRDLTQKVYWDVDGWEQQFNQNSKKPSVPGVFFNTVPTINMNNNASLLGHNQLLLTKTDTPHLH